MAEAFLRDMAGEKFEALSAGAEVSDLDPDAAEAMREVGLDISPQRLKRVNQFMGERMAYLVTLCDREVERTCPIFPGTTWRLRWPIESPAAASGQEERRAIVRRARDEIRRHVAEFVRANS